MSNSNTNNRAYGSFFFKFKERAEKRSLASGIISIIIGLLLVIST